MGDPQQEHNHYYTEGLIPVTPQARQFGFDLPVHVTQKIWKDLCVAYHGKKSRSTDARIFDVLRDCFAGLTKRMATTDDFVSFVFEHRHTNIKRPAAKKPVLVHIGARLMLDPDDNSPWLLLYVDGIDTTAELKRGENPDDFDKNASTSPTDTVTNASIEVYADDESGDIEDRIERGVFK